MADDTRDTNTPAPRGQPPGATQPPDHVNKPKIYEVFNAPPSANALPEGSGQNTAGAASRQEAPTLVAAVKTVRLDDFKQVHMYPCVRESLLVGIGGGFGIGGVRALWGAQIPKAANWAVGTFVALSLANYEFCLYKRSIEKGYMKRAVDIIDKKKVEKEKAAQEKRNERRRLKEEENRRIEAEKRSWKRGWGLW